MMKQFSIVSLAALVMSALLVSSCSKENKSTIENPGPGITSAVPTLTFGHVGHDHHTALFVAVDHSNDLCETSGIRLEAVKEFSRYKLIKKGRHIADVEIIKVGGGAKMPTALSQGIIDMGMGGTAPVLAAIDKGAPIRLVAPLHNKGDMFVLKPDYPATGWREFTTAVKASSEPVRIGYKSPSAVAKIIFEDALKYEGIPFSGDVTDKAAKVIMVNVKGGTKLNAALAGGMIDGYAGNNPFPAIGKEKGMLKIICDLEDLPPQRFRNHPCCCVAARAEAIREKSEAMEAMMVLLLQATDVINDNPDAAVAAAAHWIGTSETVERESIPTSGYSMAADAEWHDHMRTWLTAMNDLKLMKNKLDHLDEADVGKLAYDLTILKKARKYLAEHKS